MRSLQLLAVEPDKHAPAGQVTFVTDVKRIALLGLVIKDGGIDEPTRYVGLVVLKAAALPPRSHGSENGGCDRHLSRRGEDDCLIELGPVRRHFGIGGHRESAGKWRGQ